VFFDLFGPQRESKSKVKVKFVGPKRGPT
jgi:hypothetical protein